MMFPLPLALVFSCSVFPLQKQEDKRNINALKHVVDYFKQQPYFALLLFFYFIQISMREELLDTMEHGVLEALLFRVISPL